MLTAFADLTISEIVIYSTFIFTSIFGFTSLMDMHKLGLVFELLATATGITILVLNPGWFGLAGLLPGAGMIMSAYLLVIPPAAIYFLYFDRASAPFKPAVLKSEIETHSQI